MSKNTPKSTEHTFETALERLEQIVEEMEGDRLALEELLGRYEEGTRLVKVCQQRLDSAEKRIELIAKEASGAVALSAFDPAGASQTFVSNSNATAPSRQAPAVKKSEPEDVSLF